MKKKFSIAGMIAGVLLVICGVLALSGILGSAKHYTHYPTDEIYGNKYSRGYAQFNGDYYTYSVNNSAQAASAAEATERNLKDISEFLCMYGGLCMIIFGIMAVCGFGIVFSDCIKPCEEENINIPKQTEENLIEDITDDSIEQKNLLTNNIERTI